MKKDKKNSIESPNPDNLVDVHDEQPGLIIRGVNENKTIITYIESFFKFFGKIGGFILHFFEVWGIQFMRVYKSFFKKIGHVFSPVGRFLTAFFKIFIISVDTLLLKSVHFLVNEVRELKNEIKSVWHNVSKAFQKNMVTFFSVIVFYIKKSFKVHRKLFIGALNVAIPVVAIIILVNSVGHWQDSVYALQVNYNGSNIGYVSNEAVYKEAVELAKARVADYGGDTTFEEQPQYTLTQVSRNDISDANTVCDNLIESSDSVIGLACGVYVDGKFICSVKNETDVTATLDELLKQYSTGAENERVEFVQEIERVQGLYPVDTLWTAQEIKDLFTGKTPIETYYKTTADDTIESVCAKFGITEEKLRELNPDLGPTLKVNTQLVVSTDVTYLTIQVVRLETKIEEIDYETVEVEDDSRYVGYRRVTTQGEKGEDQVVEEVVYIGGEEVSRTEVSRTRIKEPVKQVITVGTIENSYSGSGDVTVIPTTGRFVWPVIGLSHISSGYGYRWGKTHRGLDITGSGAYGKTIVAADDGVVERASWYGSYGKCVIINHGDGYKTLYAHMSSIECYVGQTVSAGQKIGLVGSTGNSTGPHLHFEVHYNGSAQNPGPYLGLS